MAISNELLSTTLYSIRDREVDELFKRNVFIAHAKRAKGIEYENGGIKIQRPLSIYEHSTISQFPTGYEALSLAISDTLQPAVYEWCDFAAPIVISRKEEMENSGEKAIVKILDARTRNVVSMLQREFNKQILAGNSSVLTQLNTLNGVASTTGFLENAAVGSQTNTVGGLSKATLDVRGWYNQRETASGDFSTNGLDAMFNLWTKANSISPEGSLDCIVASEAGFVNYKRVIQAQERYIDSSKLDAGRMVLTFNGTPMEQDLDMPVNVLNTSDFTMYFLNFSGIKLVFHDDGEFKPAEFQGIPGTTARTSHIYAKVQLIADHLGSQGVLVAGNTF